MLLQFKAQNYRSFKNEFVFNMQPAAKQRDLNYSVLSKKVGNKLYKALCSSVIYGPNASGKTNAIGAIDAMRTIVLRGNIRESNVPDLASSILSLMPNIHSSSEDPVCFYIKFIENDFLIEYELKLKLGQCFDKEFKRSIGYERLSINGFNVFIREDSHIDVAINDLVESFMTDQTRDNINSLNAVANSNINPLDLFLVNGFKSFYSNEIAEIVLGWFSRKLLVLYRIDNHDINLNSEYEKDVYYEEHIDNAAKAFGSHNTVGFRKDGDLARKTSFVNMPNGKRYLVDSEVFESLGTLKFMNLIMPVFTAVSEGGTLIVDEFDASIHPRAIMNLINIFHNDEINTKQAQLIFNTHNPIFLNANLFRRDEIKFVEYQDESSELYSLSDFGTAKDGVRKGEDYMRNYFINKYGAIADVDFTDIIKDAMNGKVEYHAGTKE